MPQRGREVRMLHEQLSRGGGVEGHTHTTINFLQRSLEYLNNSRCPRTEKKFLGVV